MPFVLEVRDLWPAAIVSLGLMRPGPGVQALERLARFLYSEAARVVVVTEAFADRAYRGDGTLVPRSEPGALLDDPKEVKAQVLRLASQVDSICLHGDTPDVLEFAELVTKTLRDAAYEVGA